MQFSMSKVALAVTGLSLLTGAAFAGSMGDINTDTKRWFAFAAPIYGRITDGSIDRNTLAIITAPGLSRTEYVPALNSDWGLNVGVGYRFGANATDQLSFGYTYLQNTGKKTLGSGVGSEVNVDAISNIIFSMEGPFSASARTKITYNDFQLALSRMLDGDWNKNLELSRSYAIKATIIDRSMNVQYNGGVRDFGNTLIPGADTNSYKFNFFGIGPKAGLGARYKFTEGFSVGGDLSLAILAGYAKSRYNEALNLSQAARLFNTPPATSSVYTYNKQHPSSALLALVLGGNFSLKQSFAMQNASKLDVELGYGGEAYIPSASDRIGPGFSNNFAMENIFLKFSYFS